MSRSSNTFQEDKKGIDDALQALKVRDDEAGISENPDHNACTAREAGKSKTADTDPSSIAHTQHQLASHAVGSSDQDTNGSHGIGDSKWDDTISRTKLEAAAEAASSGEHDDAKARWNRAFLFAQQIQGPKMEQQHEEQDQDPVGVTETSREGFSRTGNSVDLKAVVKNAKAKAYNRDPETGKRRPFKGAGGQKAVKVKKKLEEQHWLEMIDPSHRYGSNLKYYFEEWKLSNVHGNFFYWLDNGEGKKLSLAKCPREKLESERILYLSAEQRKHYQVSVDSKDGKFRWVWPSQEAVHYCKDEHPLVDTTEQKWTDLGEGRGVAPVAALPAPNCQQGPQVEAEGYGSSDSDEAISDEIDDSDDSSDSSFSSFDIPAEARPGALRRTSSASLPDNDTAATSTSNDDKVQPEGKNPDQKKKNQKGDVWIYASDSQYRIYLGIKQKGYFQHSSFLAGGPITSAGTLVIKDGVLIACNPMSGHYRTKAVYFKRFIEELERQGADLSNVKVGKTELKLWFVERANTLHSLRGKARRLAKGVEKKLHMDGHHDSQTDATAESDSKQT